MQSCRIWLQSIFEQCGEILGSIGKLWPSVWSQRKLSGYVPKMIVEKANLLNARYSSILMEQVQFAVVNVACAYHFVFSSMHLHNVYNQIQAACMIWFSL